MFIRKLIIPILLIALNSCSVTREIPVQTIEKVVVRDSLVYISDTVKVEIPKEVVKEVLPELDTSTLQTSVAKSVAYLDTAKRQIHHTLEQKGTIATKIDTHFVTKYVEKIREVEVPIEVEVIKYKRDTIFWISIILNIVVILLIFFRLYLKFKV